MKIFGFNISRSAPKSARRSYDGAKSSYLTDDWLTVDGPADQVSRASIEILRRRARDMERNNPYVEAILAECESNIVGQHGFSIRPKPRKSDSRYKGSVAPVLDQSAAEKIGNWWKHHSQAGQFDVTGRFAREEFERLVIRSVVRDGGALVRLVDGYLNDSRFAVQGIEIDALDPGYNSPGERISMSVEHDEWWRPVRYYLREIERMGMRTYSRKAVAADQMLHVHRAHRFSATQSASWIATAMMSLRHLGEYEQAEVIAARSEAEKLGFFKETGPGQYTGPEDAQGNLVAPSAPGQWERLPEGVEPHVLDPSHPNSAYPDFRKAILRQICAGFPANYNIVAQDLEGVSFSSIRQGVLSERDQWRVLQSFFIGALAIPIYERALKMALTSGQIEGLGVADFERCRHKEVAGRSWPWVDPLKDIQALAAEITLGINSRQAAAREKGKPDFAAIVEENAEDVALLQEAGLPTVAPVKGQQGQAQPSAEDE